MELGRPADTRLDEGLIFFRHRGADDHIRAQATRNDREIAVNDGGNPRRYQAGFFTQTLPNRHRDQGADDVTRHPFNLHRNLDCREVLTAQFVALKIGNRRVVLGELTEDIDHVARPRTHRRIVGRMHRVDQYLAVETKQVDSLPATARNRPLEQCPRE